MTARRDFDGFLSDWLDDKAGRSAPDYADEILARTSETRQRPRWSSLGRWLPMESALRERQGLSPRLVWLLALLALLVVMAAFALLAGVGSFHAPRFGASANGSIVFVDGGSLRIADEDGTVVSSGTPVPDGADQLTFSPDGTKLAYLTLKGPASLVISDPDGSHAVVVAAGGAAEDEPIAWSPDGRRIAFAVLTGNGEAIWAVDADGNNLKQVTAIEADGGPVDPAWSPDGTWIAFFSGPTSALGLAAISLVHPDGTGLQTLKVPQATRDALAWSPDPEKLRLTFTAKEVPPSGSTQGMGIFPAIKVYDLATATETRIITTSILSGAGVTWSPDGTRIAWWGDGTHTISIANGVADGTPMMVLPGILGGCTEHPELAARAICGPARWSPDSRWLFGPGVGGTAIVFGLADGTLPSHAITLDHSVSGGASTGWQVDWQSVAPS